MNIFILGDLRNFLSKISITKQNKTLGNENWHYNFEQNLPGQPDKFDAGKSVLQWKDANEKAVVGVLTDKHDRLLGQDCECVGKSTSKTVWKHFCLQLVMPKKVIIN